MDHLKKGIENGEDVKKWNTQCSCGFTGNAMFKNWCPNCDSVLTYM